MFLVIEVFKLNNRMVGYLSLSLWKSMYVGVVLLLRTWSKNGPGPPPYSYLRARMRMFLYDSKKKCIFFYVNKKLHRFHNN